MNMVKRFGFRSGRNSFLRCSKKKIPLFCTKNWVYCSSDIQFPKFFFRWLSTATSTLQICARPSTDAFVVVDDNPVGDCWTDTRLHSSRPVAERRNRHADQLSRRNFHASSQTYDYSLDFLVANLGQDTFLRYIENFKSCLQLWRKWTPASRERWAC